MLRNADLSSGWPAWLRRAASAQTGSRPASRKLKSSLAQWSLHKAIQSRLITNLDFSRIARQHFGTEGLEFFNTLWGEPTSDYVRTLKRNMSQAGTQCVLIMCDIEGFMGHPDQAERLRAADNHRRWVDLTAELGGHSIRTNRYPCEKQPVTAGEVKDFVGRCAESFTWSGQYAAKSGINVIIENPGGISSEADVVADLMKAVNLAS